MNMMRSNAKIIDMRQYEDCTLMLADCLDVLPVEADAVITDPPYGIGFAAQPTKWQRRKGKMPETWDDRLASNVEALASAAALVVIWGGNNYPLPPKKGWLVWHKPDSPPSMGDAEMAWVNVDTKTCVLSWSIAATNAERVGHPTQKPVRVMTWSMEKVGVPIGATVLDPFMGSGTTGIACIRTGRKFIGIERDPKHFKTACERIKQELSQGILIPPTA